MLFTYLWPPPLLVITETVELVNERKNLDVFSGNIRISTIVLSFLRFVSFIFFGTTLKFLSLDRATLTISVREKQLGLNLFRGNSFRFVVKTFSA